MKPPATPVAPEHDPITRIRTSLRDGDVEAAVRLLLMSWIGSITGPRFHEVDALCVRLPQEFGEDPRILAIRACAQDALGEHEVARMLLSRAQAATGADSHPTHDDWHLTFAEMVLLDDRALVAAASSNAWQLYSQGVELDPASRTAALHHLGWAYLRHRNQPELGAQVLALAMRESAARGDESLQLRATHQLACLLAWSGRLLEAARTLEDIAHEPLLDAPWKLNSEGVLAATQSTIAYWTNDMVLARSALDSLPSGQPTVVSFAATARLMLALIAAATQDRELLRRAQLELQRMPSQELRGLEWEVFRQMLHAVFSEATGHRSRALSIVRKIGARGELPLVTVVSAGVLRRAGKHDEALRMLQTLQQYQQLSYVRVTTLVTAAVLHDQGGRTQIAHELCEHALLLAQAENLRRPFSDRDLALRMLLTEHLAWGTQHEAFVLACLAEDTELGAAQALTRRERAVAAELRSSKTVNEIAEALGVSMNTVKTQLRSIYRKLGVVSRREAIEALSR